MRGIRTAATLIPVKARNHNADLALTRAATTGHEPARRELVERLLDRVVTVVRCLVSGDRNAEDYSQEALIAILQSAENFRGESSLETWAERITVRVAMRRIRNQGYRDGIVALDSTRETASAFPSSEHELARKRFWRHIEAALHRLSSERRSVLTLKLVLGYSVVEIAELTDAPINTVRDRLAVGRRLLRQAVLEDPVLVEMIRDKGIW